jgi:hypothetical protein
MSYLIDANILLPNVDLSHTHILTFNTKDVASYSEITAVHLTAIASKSM